MAFVFRSDKIPAYIAKAATASIGPGYYELQQEHQQNTGKPFNATSEKWPKLSTKQSPGPGAYNMPNTYEGQKVIFQSEENEIKILEVPKPMSVFRSTTLRFRESKTEGPGPTEYNNIQPRKKFHSSHVKSRKANVIDQIMATTKYQSIPSIPGNAQSYGYAENQNNDLVLYTNDRYNQPNTVGPGSYELMNDYSMLKPRCVSWHQPQTKQQTMDSIGPGSYDIMGSALPMYQMKPTTAFTSKCTRANEFKFRQSSCNAKNSSYYTKKGIDNKQYSFQLSTNAGSKCDSEEESEYSYIDDATPGPGYYGGSTTDNSTVIHKQQHNKANLSVQFKSRCQRFGGIKNQVPPGPGSYDLEVRPARHHGPCPPFNIQKQRFEQLVNDNPAPTAYNPNITMEDTLISKLKKAPLGQFGTNEDRFKDSRQNGPGPGTYTAQLTQDLRQSSAKGTWIFKSQSDKIEDIVKPTQAPAPGSYDQSANTIANAVKLVEDEDPTLAIQKPPFGTGASRFKPEQPIREEDEDEPQYQDKCENTLFKKQAKNIPPFNSREQRFIQQSTGIQPGPGQYHEGLGQCWNKRTFNIIFAEI